MNVPNRFLILLCFANNKCQCDFKVGILYEERETVEINSIKIAFDYVNDRILPKQMKISYLERSIKQSSPIDTVIKACDLISSGIIAQIGPGSSMMVGYIKAIYSKLHIPLIAPVATSIFLERVPYIFHMVPSDRQQSVAIAEIVRHFNWTKINIIVSSDSYGVTGMLGVIKMASELNWQIITYQKIESLLSSSLMNILNNVKNGGSRITIINCSGFESRILLELANKFEMTGTGWIWLLTDGAVDSIAGKLTGGEKCQLSNRIQSNIVEPTLNIRIPNDVEVRMGGPDTPAVWQRREKALMLGSRETQDRFISRRLASEHLVGMVGTSLDSGTGELFDDFATFYKEITMCDQCSLPWIDSVLLVAYAVRDFPRPLVTAVGLSCIGTNLWDQGSDFIRVLNQVNESGIDQHLQFSSDFPVGFRYTIKNSREDGWKKVGQWSSVSGFQRNPNEVIYFPGKAVAASDYINTLNGKQIRVVTVREDSFLTFTGIIPSEPDSDILPGEVKGFGVDFLAKLSEMLNFSYTLYESPDGAYGSKDSDTGVWNGMIKELTFKNADMAVASLTINKRREEDVDFTMPFMDLGLSFILRKEKTMLNSFGFLLPFSFSVWTMLLLTVVLVGIFISTFERLSSNGSHGDFVYTFHNMERISRWRQCRKTHRLRSKHALGFMSPVNAIFFAISTFLGQGFERYPSATSSRIVTLIWWLSVIILTAEYKAKLGAITISKRLEGEINSVEDLYVQSTVQYGRVFTIIANTITYPMMSLYVGVVLPNALLILFIDDLLGIPLKMTPVESCY